MNPIAYDEAPKRLPREGGLRSVVDDIRTHDRGALGIKVQWSVPGFAFPSAAIGSCYAVDVEPDEEKLTEGIITGESSFSFIAYAGVECFIGGMTEEGYLGQASDNLETGFDVAVERRIFELLLDPEAPDAVPGPVTDITDAIAEADNLVDSTYPGRPILWMNRAQAVRAYSDGTLKLVDGKLVSPNNSPVISTAAITERNAVWATPSVTLWLSESIQTAVRQLEKNRHIAIAERGITVGFDSLGTIHRINIA